VPYYDLNMQTVSDWDPSSVHVGIEHVVDGYGDAHVEPVECAVQGITMSIFYLAAYSGSSSLMLAVNRTAKAAAHCYYSSNLLLGPKMFSCASASRTSSSSSDSDTYDHKVSKCITTAIQV